MKKIVLPLVICISSIATGAVAAEGNASAWAGPYAGIGAGMGIDQHKWTTTAVPDPLNQVPTNGTAPGDNSNPANIGKNGARSEIYFGYNYAVTSAIVAGVEVSAGYNFSGGKSIYGIPGTYVNAVQTYPSGLPDFTAGKTTWDGGLRARLGYAVSPTDLVFGTAGLSLANVDYHVYCTNSIGWCDAYHNERQSQIRLGYSLGAGLEHKLTSNVSAKLEYRYSDLGSKSTTWLGDVGTDTFMSSTSLKTHTVMLGLTYHFGK